MDKVKWSNIDSVCALHIVGDTFPDSMEPKGETVEEVALRLRKEVGSKLHALAKKLGVNPVKSTPKGIYVGSHKDDLYDLYEIFLIIMERVDKL